MDYSQKLKKLLQIALKENASDLHISVGHSPIFRITGKLIPLLKEEKIFQEISKGLAFSLMTETQKE